MKKTTIENSTDVSWILPEFYKEMLEVKDLYNWSQEQIDIVNNHMNLFPENSTMMIGFHRDRKRVFVSEGGMVNIIEISD